MDSSLLALIQGSTGALVVLALVAYFFSIGKLHSDREFQREVKRGDTLEAAVAEKDKALEAAAARADAAVRASELIADAFTEARRRRGGGRAGTHGTA
jgi:hypothetical protein